MKFSHRIACALAFVVATTGAMAGASKTEAIAQVNAAVAHVKKVGAEQATKDFNTEPQWKVNGMNESPRVSRRLNTLRGLSHEQVEQVLTRGA